MLRDIFKFLASLKLALILLAVIIIASIYGTVYESKFSAEVARKWIYNAPWFNLWLGMLCVNLFAVAAIRYPWKPHQTGFVITHAGIIILLIGGMIDRRWGVEGMIPLYRGQAGKDYIDLHEEVFLVRVDGKESRTGVIIKELLDPKDFMIPVAAPSPDVKIEIIDKYPPLAQFSFKGPMMPEPMDLWMFLNDSQEFGPATFRFVSGMPPEPKKKVETEKKAPRHERYFVFGKQDFPIGKTLVGEPTKAEPKLIVSADGKDVRLKLNLLGKSFDIDVNKNLKEGLPLEGLEGWRLFIMDYYPNFRMMPDGKPGSVGDKPENPAILFELNGPLVTVTDPEDADDPHGGMRKPKGSLTVYLGPDGKLRYFLKSKNLGESVGDLEEGKQISAWMGSEIRLKKFIGSGLTELMRKDPNALKGANLKSMNDRAGGLLCRVSCKGESREVFVTEDNSRDFEPRRIEIGGKSVELALPHRSVDLPFKVALERFDAPHEEGLDSMAAAYESTLTFQDKDAPAKPLDTVRFKSDSEFLKELGPKRLNDKGELVCAITSISDESLTIDLADLSSDQSSFVIPREQIADYTKRTHKIYMNHPTTYPESWYGPWLGTNYKFSQAGQDPNNPDYSGIQVLRDPGWMPKWVGCLMICFGIFTMFYLKPYFHGRREVAAVAAATKKKNDKVEVDVRNHAKAV